jgi:hypothetical protein
MIKIILKRTIIILLFFILGITITLAIYSIKEKHNLVHIEEMPMHLTIDYMWGYIPFEFQDKTVVNFSKLIPGQTFSRMIEVYNPFNFSVNAVIKSKGPIRQFLFIDENYLEIPANQIKNMTISARVPDIKKNEIEKKTGEFKGTLYISLYKN